MEEFDFYPPKPELIERTGRGNVALTIFSILVFALTFLFVYTDDASFVVYLVLVLIIHESGHFLMMKLFKYRDVHMFFIPLMGAFVQGRKEEYSQKQSMLVVAAGPFPGMFIGMWMIYLAATYQHVWIIETGILFLFLNLLNLLPLEPLDGGQLFKLLIRKNQELFLLIFTFVSSLVMIFAGWYIDSWFLIVIGFLMGFRVRSVQNQYQLRKELKDENINYKTTYKLLSNRDFGKIKEVLMERTPALREYIDQVSEEESGNLLASQVNSVLQSPVKFDATPFFKLVLIFMWIVSVVLPFVLLFMYSDQIHEHYEWYFRILSGK